MQLRDEGFLTQIDTGKIIQEKDIDPSRCFISSNST